MIHRLWAILGLGTLGFIISSYQTLHYYALHGGRAEFKSFCSVGSFDCEAVELSPYASLIGNLPLSGFAAGWFLTLVILAWRAQSENEENQAKTFAFIKLLGLGGLIISAIYLIIMMSILKQYCFLCLGIDAINLLIFLLSLGLTGSLWQPLKDFKGHLSSFITFGSAVLVVVTVFYLNDFSHDSKPKQSRVDQIVDESLASPPVNIDLSGEIQVLGNPDAKVTIVKYSDFECPACKAGAKMMHTVLRKHGDQVRLIYKHFPLDNKCNPELQSPLHVNACNASQASICAGKQGKFSQAYEMFFDKQETLAAAVDSVAAELGLDKVAYDACLKDPATSSLIAKNIQEGVAVQVTGTPTFFINGHRVLRSDYLDVWSELIERLSK